MRTTIAKVKKMTSGDVLEYPKVTGNDSSDDRNLRDMNAHAINCSSNSITVEYKIGGLDAAWRTLITDSLISPNGWADGAVWNQSMVAAFKVTANADCELSIKSFSEQNV